jgi:hypothetical protein
MVWVSSIGTPSVGSKHDPQPVMIKVFEAVGEPTNLFDDEVESPMCCQAARSVSEAALRWR